MRRILAIVLETETDGSIQILAKHTRLHFLPEDLWVCLYLGSISIICLLPESCYLQEKS